MTDRRESDLSDRWHDDPGNAAQPEHAPARPRNPHTLRPKRARRHRRLLPVLGYGALVVVCVCAATATFLLVAGPVELIRDRVVEQVEARSGRSLTIAGPVSLSFFPRLAVSLGSVTLSGSGGPQAPPLLSVPKLDAELSLWSALKLRAEVERVALHQPIIEFALDSAGQSNWLLARALHPTPPNKGGAVDAPTAEPKSPSAAGGPGRALAKIGVKDVRIVDGTIRYRGRDGDISEGRSLNLALSANDAAESVRVDGSLTLNGSEIAIAGTASPISAVGSDQPLRMALKLSGQPFKGSFDGTLRLTAGIVVDGTLQLEAGSAQAAATWLGRHIPGMDKIGGASLSAKVQLSGSRVTLSDIDATVGDTKLTGALALDTRKRRHLTGRLQMSKIDFGRLLMKSRRSADRGLPTRPPPDADQAREPLPTRPANRRGWRDDPINVAMLGAIDADLSVTATQTIYKDIRTGPGRLAVALERGQAKVTLDELELYGGRGRGVVTLDATGDVLVTSTNLDLDGVNLGPLLTDALQFPWLEGRGSISLALAGQGLTERKIVESLNGEVKIESRDGALIGLDVGKIVRSIQRARLPSLRPSPQEKTPFTELAGTFTVTNGVASNDDLRLIGPDVELNGAGKLDLGPRQINYTVRTKIAGAPEPGAAVRVGTLEVPVSIAGPWDRPSFGIQGQEQITETVKRIGKNLRSKDVRDTIRSFLEGDGKKRLKPRELLEQLLKKE